MFHAWLFLLPKKVSLAHRGICAGAYFSKSSRELKIMSEESFGTEDEQFSQDVPAGNGRNSFASKLSEAVNAIDVSDSLTAPLMRAIDNLLQLAGQSVGSEVASVLVRDGNDGGLRFLTATSKVRDELLKLRLPPGKGIAGLVFSTAQPMAVSDVSQEGSFWSEADKRTGFKTITLLATPLRTGSEMVGVLEFVNRPGEPPYPPFTPEEMDCAAYFAEAIAQLVDAHEIAELVESLFNYSIKTSLAATEVTEGRQTNLREWLKSVPSAPEHRDLLLSCVSLREIALRGDAERELCRDLLEALTRFTEKRSAASVSYSDF
jgi:GAF domain-containing protein